MKRQGRGKDNSSKQKKERPINFGKNIKIIKEEKGNEGTIYTVQGPNVKTWHPGRFITGTKKEKGKIVQSISDDIAIIKPCIDYTEKRNSVYGLNALNPGQNLLLNFAMDPNIHLLTVDGKWGTGKTLVTLGAASEQISQGMFDRMIFTREVVPAGRGLGYSKGNDNKKIAPWLGALYNNQELLDSLNKNQQSRSSKKKHPIIIDTPTLDKMAGSSYHNRIIILDEAQNTHEDLMEMFISRVADTSKVICIGNLDRIDNPRGTPDKLRITKENSGFTRLIKTFKHWDHAAHIKLPKIERSPLVEYLSKHW